MENFQTHGRILTFMRLFWCSLLLALTGLLPVLGAEPEAEAFDSATKAFADRFYQRAEQQFGEFAAKFPNSTNFFQAILYQAQSRHFLKKPDAAIELLDAHLPKAGPLSDQYLFWKAEALHEKGDFAGAAAACARILAEYPQSLLQLQATVSQALAFSRQKDLAKTVELLGKPESHFQKLAAGAMTNPVVFQGHLLLAESLLGLNQLAEAKAALEKMPAANNLPELEWERQHLLARIELAGPKPETALGPITSAIAIAQSASRPVRHAQALNLEAEVYKKLNQPAQAITAYEKIINAAHIPLDQRRLALLKSVELLSDSKQLTNAVARIETYLANNPQEPSADLLRLKAGELWLSQFQTLASPGGDKLPAAQRADATNLLNQARTHFNFVITQLTNSPHLGKAWLNLGWSLWEEGNVLDQPTRIQESQVSFQNAIERLTRSDDQAMARYKLADTHFYLRQYQPAATNYLHVIESYSDLPQARSGLFDKAYHQLVRSYIELNDLDRAAKVLGDLRKNFPNNARTESALFLYGQKLASIGKPAEARAAFDNFLKTYSSSSLVPEVRFAMAKTYAAEANWTGALDAHEQWLGVFTNHTLKPQVEFQRAWLYDQAGKATNALTLFTNFVTRFPLHPLAPAAQNWVADYYYGQERWNLAEQNYQQIFQNTNWLHSPLVYHSKLMAARTAFFRQGYGDARGYLTNIMNDATSPAGVVAEAAYILGDVMIEQQITSSTNQLNNYIEAANVYDYIIKNFPTNPLVPLAWGKKGDCHFQLATQYPQSYIEATNAYRMLLDTKLTIVPPAALCQAEVGLGRVFEKMAESKTGPEKEALLRQALNHYLNVVYGTTLRGAKPDPLYLKLAGTNGGRIAENLGERRAAIELYQRLLKDLPAMKSVWESRINALEKLLASNPSGR